jgi:hypothetical protein
VAGEAVLHQYRPHLLLEVLIGAGVHPGDDEQK